MLNKKKKYIFENISLALLKFKFLESTPVKSTREEQGNSSPDV